MTTIALTEVSAATGRNTRRMRVVAFCIGFPLYIQISSSGNPSIAHGHVQARQDGFYLPVLALVAVGMLTREMLSTGTRVHTPTSRRLALAAMVLSVALSMFVALLNPANGISTILSGLQLLMFPLVLLVWDGRVLGARERSLLADGLENVTLACATVLFVLRFVMPYSNRIGYPDDFGLFGIATSLRMYPSIVSICWANRAIRLARDRSFGAPPWTSIATLIGGGGLILASHSRTALLGLVVGIAIAGSILARRHAGVAGVLIVAILAAGLLALPALAEIGSFSRVVSRPLDSDANRWSKVVESVEETLASPIGQTVAPDAGGQTYTGGERAEKVEPAENQFGQYGKSAGIVALLGSVAIAWMALRDGLKTLRMLGALAAGGCIVVCVGLLTQINFSNAHVGVVALVYVWLSRCDSISPVVGTASQA